MLTILLYSQLILGPYKISLGKCEEHARANRYQFSVAKCEVISASDVEFKIDQQALPRTNCFKYLGVEISSKGINYQAFLNRRCEDAAVAANRLIGMGMNVGGFSPYACSLLYKVFIRPKLEASTCILPSAKEDCPSARTDPDRYPS